MKRTLDIGAAVFRGAGPAPRALGTSGQVLRAAALGLAGLAGACSATRPAPPPPAAILQPATSPLRIVLLWSAPVDLDLYVTDPGQETVYFANTPSGSGGRLERDRRCEPGGGAQRAQGGAKGEPFAETVTWPAPPAGRYRVGVDFGDACGAGPAAVGFRVVADVGTRRIEETGWLQPAEFRYVVLELDLGEDGP